MAKINCLNIERFKMQFGREPKMWTIEQVHDLWQRTLVKADKRCVPLLACRDEIIKHTEPDDRGIYRAYFTPDSRDETCEYTFTYDDTIKSYWVGNSRVEFSEDKFKGRNDKIQFLTANEKAFKLGQKYYELDKMVTHQHRHVQSIMVEMIEEFLRRYFKENNIIPPSVFTISIRDKKYYIQTDDEHRYVWYRFLFRDEVKEGVIEAGLAILERN